MKKVILGIAGFLGFVVLLGGAALLWYNFSLGPKDKNVPVKTVFEVKDGESALQVGENLADKGLIRSATAFSFYLKFQRSGDVMQVGTYELSPSFSVEKIVDYLAAGPEADVFTITFLPGGTLKMARATLKEASYSDADIDTAFAKKYDHPALKDKPEDMGLEGYIFGDTYEFFAGTSVDKIIETCLDELWADIQQNDLVTKFGAHGLNLYEGITLASIVQKEDQRPEEQEQIAQVFFNRMKADMNLGSDPTYKYAAEMLGVPNDINIDSPYNTRLYSGLPPGPISSPGVSALKAVADPAPNDYLFFLSGDDDVTYFAVDAAGHEQNIVDHCQVKCGII